MMNVLRGLSKCKQLSRCTSIPKRSISSDLSYLPKLKELQRQFQVNDGNPVWLKKGGTDRFLFSMIVLTEVCLLGYALSTVYKMIYPAPNN